MPWVDDVKVKWDTEGAMAEIMHELWAAKEKHPIWVSDPIHAAAILGEESGELTQAAIDYSYSHGSRDAMIKEAAQVGATAIRFLAHMDGYDATTTLIDGDKS